MSLIKSIRKQLGLSVTPTNNFTLTAEADNGTMKLARGNAGATTQDILTVDAAGATLFPSGVFGYGAGAGGAVTQLTSKSTAVTLHKPCGKVTMHNASLAANTQVQFQLNNSFAGLNDVVLLTIDPNSGITGTNYTVKAYVANGVIYIILHNVSAGALAEVILLNFVIIKGAAA